MPSSLKLLLVEFMSGSGPHEAVVLDGQGLVLYTKTVVVKDRPTDFFPRLSS